MADALGVQFRLSDTGVSRTDVHLADRRRTITAGAIPAPAIDTDAIQGQSYFVEELPVEMHCHSIGDVDFSDFRSLDLVALNATAAAEGVVCVPTMYLARDALAHFTQFMARFKQARCAGLLPFVPAVALEGPLLASHGGTPTATVWAPTRHEWNEIASCGPLGLAYVVISPDALAPHSELAHGLGLQHPSLNWIVRTLVEGGVRPALGHYTKQDPVGAAELTHEMVETAWQCEAQIPGSRVVTDHLFNDMPLNFRHAFRTRRARAERDAAIMGMDLASWNLADLDEQVGPVPAAIMRLSHQGRVAACINFDGEHVDLEIASRAVEVIGKGNIMLMTDRCDAARMGGQQLHHVADNGLWYQGGGVVAAGSQPVDIQMLNAREHGMDEARLWDLIAFTPYKVLGLDQDPWLNPGASGCFVLNDGTGQRRRIAVLGDAPERAEIL